MHSINMAQHWQDGEVCGLLMIRGCCLVVAFHGVTKHAAVGVEASDLASRLIRPRCF